MPKGGFKINKRGIREMSKELEREFAKHPITIPVQAEGSPRPISVVNHHAPVIYGGVSNSSMVWGNGQANLSQNSQTGAGQEDLVSALERILKQMPRDQLPAEDVEDLEAASSQVLEEVRSSQPEQAHAKRGLRTMLRILNPIAQGLQAGASEGAQSWARDAIQSLP